LCDFGIPLSKKLEEISVVVESGQKYQTEQGFKAVKDGIKPKACDERERLKKPSWLRVKLQNSKKFNELKEVVHQKKLATVCEEAKCPNMSECWSHGTATIMLMGAVCTRACRFCSVDTGNPRGWLDLDEPEKSAETVAQMALQYVVLTSVDRDDL
jgi:lipoic acid synthetase